MAYVALKPCKLSGQTFMIGDSVPVEVVLPGAARNLVRMGIIGEVAETGTAPAPATPTIEAPTTITVALRGEEGDMPLEITPEGLQSIFDALTSNVAGAEEIINEMTEDDALILLNASDTRKAIKAATEERAKALMAAQEAENKAEEGE